METWRILHPLRILHSSGAVSVHDDVSQATLEPGPSGPELSDLPTEQPRPPRSFRIAILIFSVRDESQTVGNSPLALL